MRLTPWILPSAMLLGLAGLCLAKYQQRSEQAANKVYTDRMSDFEKMMWAQAICDRCGRNLDPMNPKDGVYQTRTGEPVTLHGLCAIATNLDHPKKGKRHASNH